LAAAGDLFLIFAVVAAVGVVILLAVSNKVDVSPHLSSSSSFLRDVKHAYILDPSSFFPMPLL
jgi:hypothetical protein